MFEVVKDVLVADSLSAPWTFEAGKLPPCISRPSPSSTSPPKIPSHKGGQVQERLQSRHISVMAEESSLIESLILVVDACPPLAVGPEIFIQDAKADVMEDVPWRGSFLI